MSDPYVIPTESVVDCIVCDKPNRTDIYDDIRTGDWAYLFQCWSCDHINDEHGNNLDRGAVTPAASFWMFAVAVAGIVLFLYQPVIFCGTLGVLLYAAVLLVIIAFAMGAKQGEHRE